jgi:hypothetical protein
VLFAQAAKQGADSDSGGPAYVGPYALVIFGIAIGLLLALHPSRRRDRAKPESYSERIKR